jgi:hypothetical protein
VFGTPSRRLTRQNSIAGFSKFIQTGEIDRTERLVLYWKFRS